MEILIRFREVSTKLKVLEEIFFDDTEKAGKEIEEIHKKYANKGANSNDVQVSLILREGSEEKNKMRFFISYDGMLNAIHNESSARYKRINYVPFTVEHPRGTFSFEGKTVVVSDIAQRQPLSLNDLSKVILVNAKAKGFHDRELNVGERLMLIVSELGEALDADRADKQAKWDEFHFDTLSNVVGNDPDSRDLKSFTDAFEKHIKSSFGDELADTIIRILELAASLGINIEKHVNYKIEYNLNRPHLHGKKY